MFDLSLLPMNLDNGRNIGELPGFLVYTAPRSHNSARKNDVCIFLIHVPDFTEKMPYDEWGTILSKEYYAAKGSFTMGVTNACKALFDKTKGKGYPDIHLNILILRGTTMLIGFAGGMNTTIIYQDHIENYSDATSSPITNTSAPRVCFSQVDIHYDDLILLNTKVPEGWNNQAIMEAIGDTPMNAIRYLLEQSHGTICSGVVQVKSGRGEIIYRNRPMMVTDVRPEHPGRMEFPGEPGASALSAVTADPDKPLYRSRRVGSSELTQILKETKSQEPEPAAEEPAPSVVPEPEPEPHPETEEETEPEPVQEEIPEEVITPEEPPAQKNKTPKEPKPRKKRNWKRFFLLLFCGIMVPVAVVAAMFVLYSERSRSKLHRESLSSAVETAREAINAETPKLKEFYWHQTLDEVNEASYYGSSPAARELKNKALESLDLLSGAQHTTLRYGNTSAMPAGVVLTDFAVTDQYTYALDEGTGIIHRFTASGGGLSLDSNFSCKPGDYYPREYLQKLREEEKDYRFQGETSRKEHVGSLIAFVLLPSGSPDNDVLAAFDKNGNILYCSASSASSTGRLIQPETPLNSIDAVYFTDHTLYVLDTKSSSVWTYAYDSEAGFAYRPETFFGSYAPTLNDAIDMAVYKEHSYFLSANGSLTTCDFTGYKPICTNITSIEDPEKGVAIDFSNRHISKMMINRSPDISIYLMDGDLQQVINLSVKLNFIRTIAPKRDAGDTPVTSSATGFGITGQNKLIWAYEKDLYIGNMP